MLITPAVKVQGATLALPFSNPGLPRSCCAVLTPVPVRLALVGLLDALLVTVSVPLRVPDAVGLNVTLMEQVPP